MRDNKQGSKKDPLYHADPSLFVGFGDAERGILYNTFLNN